jgi:hypothetical protein
MDTHALTNELDRRLAGLKDALAGSEPPASTDLAIAKAIDRAAGKRARASRGPRLLDRWLAWPLALAATIAVVAIAVRAIPDGDVSPVKAASASTPRFIAVVPVAEIEQSSDAYVVPARVPRMALAQFGLPVNPARADDAVDTELLVRPDGAVLALRFVN